MTRDAEVWDVAIRDSWASWPWNFRRKSEEGWWAVACLQDAIL